MSDHAVIGTAPPVARSRWSAFSLPGRRLSFSHIHTNGADRLTARASAAGVNPCAFA